MISEAEALQRVLAAITPAAAIQQPLLLARGLYVAQEMRATIPLPGFDNSMMDGYAVLAADTTGQTPLQVTGEQPAGVDRHLRLEKGCAIRLFTGAPMPAGADAVIMQEDVEKVGAQQIRCLEPVVVGENVRRRGADLCVGQSLIKAGERLTAGRLGVLASQGMATVPVHAPPKVAILSTGDELRPLDSGPLEEGQLYNSNGVMLQSLVAELGIPHCTAHHCPDDLKVTVSTLRELLASHDIVILSGGVSVGDHDHVKPALQRLGMPPELWRVKVKPGKPFLFARRERSDTEAPALVFGLPGNPVSSFVTFHLFVRQALLRWMGAAETAPAQVRVQVAQRLVNDGDRPHYLRGKIEDGRFTLQGLQQSHALFALSQANALLRLEAHTTLEAGAAADACLL